MFAKRTSPPEGEPLGSPMGRKERKRLTTLPRGREPEDVVFRGDGRTNKSDRLARPARSEPGRGRALHWFYSRLSETKKAKTFIDKKKYQSYTE